MFLDELDEVLLDDHLILGSWRDDARVLDDALAIDLIPMVKASARRLGAPMACAGLDRVIDARLRRLLVTADHAQGFLSLYRILREIPSVELRINGRQVRGARKMWPLLFGILVPEIAWEPVE